MSETKGLVRRSCPKVDDRAVAGDEGDVVAEREQLVADAGDQVVVIAHREIGPADRALEQHVADHGEAGRAMDEHDMAGRVAGAVNQRPS